MKHLPIRQAQKKPVSFAFLAREMAHLLLKTYQNEVIYPEEEFQSIFKGVQQVFGVDSETAEKAFSEFFMKISLKLFPWFFKVAPNARSFLEKVPQIHRNFPAANSINEFKEKLFVVGSSPEKLTYRYVSPNRLCVTLTTIARLTMDFYKERGTIVETLCMKKGADACLIEITFQGKQELRKVI